MKKSTIVSGSVIAGIVAFIAILLSLIPAMGGKNWPQEIAIIQPYAFATTDTAKSAAAFFTLQNGLEDDDILLSASSDIARVTEIHENVIDPDDGQMMMRKISQLPIAAQEEVKLQPKGYHIMFIDMKEPLAVGERFPVTLNFEKAGQKDIFVKIIEAGRTPTQADFDDHHDIHADDTP